MPEARSNIPQFVADLNDKYFENRIGYLFHEAIKNDDLKRVYGEKRLEEINQKITNGLKSIRDVNATLPIELIVQRLDGYLGAIESKMIERIDLQDRADNVRRQIQEIEEFAKKPSRIKVTNYLEQAHRNTPWAGNGSWNPERDGFGENLGSNINSWRGGNEFEHEFIQTRENPIYHTLSPSTFYQNNAIDSSKKVLERMMLNEAELNAAFEGRELTSQEIKKLNITSESKNKTNNILEFAANSVVEGVGPLFRGLAYDTKAHKTGAFKKQTRKYYKTLSDLIYQIGPNYLDGALYIKYLESCNEDLRNSTDPFEIELYHKVREIIANTKQKLEKKVADDLKAFEESLNKTSEEFYEKNKEFTKIEDEAFKWQILCALTLIAPFAPAVVGIGSLNIVSPILHAAGKILCGSQGFATNLVGIMNSLGPFSYMANLAKIPYATEWLLNNTPLVNAVLGNDGLINLLTRNDIAQNLFSSLSPLEDSPLPLLVIAGLAATKAAASGYDHYAKEWDEKKKEGGKWDFAEKNQKKFKTTVDEFVKVRKNNLETIINGGQNSLSIAEEIINAKKKAFCYGKTIEAISKMNSDDLKMFDDIQLKSLDSKVTTLSKMKEEEPHITAQEITKVLLQNNIRSTEATYGEIEKRVANALGADHQAYKAHYEKELIFTEAKKSRLNVDSKSDVKKIEAEIVASEKGKLRSLMYDNSPDGSITPKAVSNLYDRSQYRVAAQ